MPDFSQQYLTEVTTRVDALAAEAAAGGLDSAIDLLTDGIRRGGVIQAFGTGHSGAFAMELAGRAGGLIPANRIRLVDLALYGNLTANEVDSPLLERDPTVVDQLLGLYPINPADVFIIASNSGVNASIVGLALAAKANGHPVIAVTSMAHTMAVTPKHASGKRLSEVANIVIDNRAPYGDTTIELGSAAKVGAVSSITAAFIAQLLTIGIADRLASDGAIPPVYISANIPEGDAHNHALEARFGNRIKRGAPTAPDPNERLEVNEQGIQEH
ncbi:MAG: SIS domain-containing protein [Nakamurella sp.]